MQLPPKRRQIIMLSLKKSDIDLAKKFVADLGETSTTNDAGKDDGNGVT